MNPQLTCKLTTPALQHRRATVIADLKMILLKKEAIENGLSFAFPADDPVLDKLTDFIKFERMCCDFLSFKLMIASDGSGVATLEVTGPTGTQEFLEHEVGF